MLHPLRKQVRRVRRRAHRLVLVQGLAWWAALTLVVTFAFGFTDYLMRFQDDSVRVLAFAVVASFLAVTFWRVALPGFRQRTTDLQVAQLIEARFPELQDRLSSSLAFLGEPSGKPAMGSPALQESVIAETDRLVATLNIFDCLEGHHARRGLGVLAVVAAITCAVSALDLSAARMASQRLLLPWSNAAWPRRNHLEFVDPPRLLARGSEFEVMLRDRNGHLPATATLEFKFAENSEPQTRRIQRVNGQMVARLTNVTQAFAYRAVGGDDHTMAWHELEVREPIRLTNVEIFVQPPEYTGLPPRNSNRLIRTWAGSTIRLQAELSAPAEAVRIDSSFADPPDLQLAGNGRRIDIPSAAAPWVPTESGIFLLRIKDRGGLEVTSDLSFDLTLLEDVPPTVSLETPTENEAYLSGAVVPVRTIIKDDLAVRSASLVYRDQSWPVFDNPASDQRSPSDTPRADGDRHIVDAELKLDSLQLQPGDIVEFHVAATDGKPQTGTSGVRHLTILSQEDFDNRLDQDQAELRQRIEKALVMQLSIKSHTETLATATDWSTGTPDSESLQAAHWGQQQIRQLVNGTDGALPIADKLWQRLANNHAHKPDVAARLKAVVEQLGALAEQALPAIEHQLGSALKISQTSGKGPSRKERSQSQAAISAAQDQQQHAVEVLKSLLQRFAKWGNVRRIAAEVADMRRQQEQLIHDTNALNTVGKTPGDLTAEEAEQLRQLVQRQAQLARQADRLVVDLETLKQQVASDNPAFAENLRRAFEAVQQTDVAAAAHEARRNLEENQIGSAASGQRDVLTGLQQILDAISQRTTDAMGTLLASVDGWLVRQQSLSTATGELHGQGAALLTTPAGQRQARDLAAGQKDLAVEIAAAAQRQPRPVVRHALGEADGVMSEAALELTRANVGPVTQRLQQTAHAQLLRVKEALQFESRQSTESTAASGDPADQQSGVQDSQAKIGIADLQLLRQMQIEINQQTAQIEQSRDADGSLGTDQAAKLGTIAGRQTRLVELVFSLMGEQAAATDPAQPKTGSDLDDALRKANIPGFSED